MKTVSINTIGLITGGTIHIGVLTFFVGYHASCDSILLQLVKLLVDKDQIRRTLEQYGYVWGSDMASVIDRYFGEGMSGILGDDSAVTFNGEVFQLSDLLLSPTDTAATESLFYVPAQRVVCLQNGWPRFFNDYEDSV